MSHANGDYFIPIEGLIVPTAWRVGRLTIHPGPDAAAIVAGRHIPDDGTGRMRQAITEIVSQGANSSVAELPATEDIDHAIDEVRAGLDALRLFHLSRLQWNSATFGLPGDLYQASISWALIGSRSGAGGLFRGDHTGWAFDAAAHAAWSASEGFQFLSQSLATPGVSEGARRASTGSQLFSRAAREHRPDLKILGLVAALEAWLLDRQTNSQTMRLARHAAWFGCGQAGGSLCGRDRDICPYLFLSPDTDRARLKKLQRLGNSLAGWRCSEWLRVMNWYEIRSDTAHGNPFTADSKAASDAEYWIAHFMAEPILNWLRLHPQSPVSDLEAAIAAVPLSGDSQLMLNAIDSGAGFPPGMVT